MGVKVDVVPMPIPEQPIIEIEEATSATRPGQVWLCSTDTIIIAQTPRNSPFRGVCLRSDQMHI